MLFIAMTEFHTETRLRLGKENSILKILKYLKYIIYVTENKTKCDKKSVYNFTAKIVKKF